MPELAQPVRRPEGLPAILPAQRVDWCTPAEALEPCYKILGPVFGIDPCSNDQSIVKAKFKVELPEGSEITEAVGGLVVPWHEHGTFFVNPPFGDGIVNMWVAKAILEASLGAEGIMLLPAYVSAYFFDDLVRHAQVICLWGKPGETNSRMKFIGAEESATFPVMLVYFGPQVARAADVLERVGHIMPPAVIASWLRMVRGQVIPGAGDALDDMTLQDPIYAAIRKRVATRYDTLIEACASVADLTLAELGEQDHPLIEKLAGLKVGEIAGGLAALQRVQPEARAMPTKRRPARRPRKKPPVVDTEVVEDDRQLHLVPKPGKRQAAREDLDRRILVELRQHEDEGLLSAELRSRVGCTAGQFRSAMKRLGDRGLVVRSGRTTSTRYHPTRS